MAIGSYPRVTVEGTGPSQNPQNGQGLMLLNPSTGLYESATASTFSGGGGGDATAANQATQITEAQTTNLGLGDISFFTQGTKDNLFDNDSGNSNAILTRQTRDEVVDVNTKLEVIRKYSAFNTFYSKVFEDHEAGNTISLNGAVKIVFQSNTDVQNIINMNGDDVTSNYVSSTRSKKSVNIGSEIICNYTDPNDLFDEIVLGAVGVFTAYYLLNPDI